MKLYKFFNIEGGTPMYNAGLYMVTSKHFNSERAAEIRNRYFYSRQVEPARENMARLRREKALRAGKSEAYALMQ